MIKADLNSVVVERRSRNGSYIRADLFADTRDEVITMGNSCASVSNLSSSDKLTMGSTVFTMDKKFGTLKSDGTWNI